MIVEKKGASPDIPDEHKDKPYVSVYRSDTDDYKIIFTDKEEREEKLRQEFDQKLENRVNQIAEAVESGARGQELADMMRKK